MQSPGHGASPVHGGAGGCREDVPLGRDSARETQPGFKWSRASNNAEPLTTSLFPASVARPCRRTQRWPSNSCSRSRRYPSHHGRLRSRRITLGADKAYDTKDFVAACSEVGATPHVAQNTSGRRRTPSTVARRGTLGTPSASGRGCSSRASSTGKRRGAVRGALATREGSGRSSTLRKLAPPTTYSAWSGSRRSDGESVAGRFRPETTTERPNRSV